MNPNIKIYCVEDLEEVSIVAFNIFSEAHQKRDNRFYIIPGGSTPKLFFKLLSKNITNWKNTQFILSDERIVENKNNHSNEVMVENELLKKVVNNEKPKLLKYNQNGRLSEIESVLKFQSPNLAFLGLGTDCHTASLFPGNSDILNEKKKICLKVRNSWENYHRVSLSFGYLMKSNQIVFMVSGEGKAKSLKECLVGNYNPIQFPAQFIFQNYNKPVHIVCDKAAGKYVA